VSPRLRSPVGACRLAIPEGYSARWLSEPEDREAITRWTAASPDACVYNTPSYVEFARKQNRRADLLWLVRDGQPVLGLPVHPVGRLHVTSGYSGMLIATAAGGSTLRRGVAALVALLSTNARLGFDVLQSAQSLSYEDSARMAELACLLDQHNLARPSLYTRVLTLDPLDVSGAAEPNLSAELLLDQGLAPYQAELRNQIRQAIRHDLHATCFLPSNASEVPTAYHEFVPLHRESWMRTGMTPHSDQYWIELARAILEGDGHDLVVYVRDPDGSPLAAVTCHLRGRRALYWAGASSSKGLQLRANPLCLHAAIQACRQLGVRSFELGRFDAREGSEKEQAITRYKAQFGGDLLSIVGFHTEPPLVAIVQHRVLGLWRR
jgi:hypothetical protein